jgi:hypothetical protein
MSANVLVFEIREIMKRGIEYIRDMWNLNDMTFTIIFTATMLCDWLVDHQSSFAEATRIAYAMLVISAFVKFLSLARVFDNFSFIVKMVVEVFREITPFMTVFVLFIFSFA